MGKWGVRLTWGDGNDYESDDTFDTEEEAYEEGLNLSSAWRVGNEEMLMSNPGDYLSEIGRDPTPPDIETFEADD
jgi:hypothetical protein